MTPIELRQTRYKLKISITELSQATRIERQDIIAYEFGSGDLSRHKRDLIQFCFNFGLKALYEGIFYKGNYLKEGDK